MKIEAFSTLEAVIQAGSFAAAALQIKRTPSAVSMQMKQLEQYLGMTLFDRSGAQVRPLPSAFEVAAAMREGLGRLDELRRRPSMAIEGVVRLGIIESLLPALLPAVLGALRRSHPRLAIQPVRGRSASLTAAVKAGQLDAAVVAQPSRGGSARLRWQPLARRDLMLLAPPDSVESNPAALLRRYDWIRYDRGTVTGEMAARHVLALVPDKRGSLELDSLSAIVAMVGAGLGVAIIHMLDPSLRKAYPVREIGLGSNAPTLVLSMVSRKASDDDRALAAVRQSLVEQLK